MVIKIEMMRCFCIVAQTGNLAEAADKLGKTQSALSMTLKQLEEHLGQRLFEGERKAHLTPFGQQAFDLSLNQVRQFDETVTNLEMMADANHGLIRIVSVPSVAALLFPAVLDYMTQRFPGVKVELRDTDSQQVLDALVAGKAEIGVASGFQPLSGISSEPLFEDQFGLVCAINHPLNRRPKNPTVDDTMAYPFIRNALCHLIRSNRFLEKLEAADVSIPNTHSLITMIQTGKWVTVLPETVARFIPKTTVFRPIIDLPDKRQVHLYVRDRARFKELSKNCREFILQQQFTVVEAQN